MKYEAARAAFRNSMFVFSIVGALVGCAAENEPSKVATHSATAPVKAKDDCTWVQTSGGTFTCVVTVTDDGNGDGESTGGGVGGIGGGGGGGGGSGSQGGGGGGGGGDGDPGLCTSWPQDTYDGSATATVNGTGDSAIHEAGTDACAIASSDAINACRGPHAVCTGRVLSTTRNQPSCSTTWNEHTHRETTTCSCTAQVTCDYF